MNLNKLNGFLKNKSVEAKDDTPKVDMTAFAEMAEHLTEAQEALATQVAAFAKLQAQFDGVSKELSSVKEVKVAMEKAANEAKFSARKEKIIAAVGTAKADALFAATESLDDAKFESIVSAMATSVDAEAKSADFKDAGVSGGIDASKVSEENSMETLLKQKYSKNSK